MKKIIIFLILIIPIQIIAQDTIVIIYNNDTLNSNDTINVTNRIIEKESVEIDTTIELSENVEANNNIEVPDVDKLFSLNKIFWTIILILIGYLLIRLFTRLVNIWTKKKIERRGREKTILPLLKVLVWFIIIYFISKIVFKPSVESILIFIAAIGIAIGFASQDILKNFFAGFVILINRPFKIGDKIKVNEVSGEVINMSLSSTTIKSGDDSVVSVPNGCLINTSVYNANTGKRNSQVLIDIFLPITVDTKKVREIIIESVKVSKYVYLAEPVQVLFKSEMNQAKLNYKMTIKAHVVDSKFESDFISEINEVIIKRLIDENFEF